MDKKNNQIAHRRIVAGREILRNMGKTTIRQPQASEIRLSVHVYCSDAACLPTTPFVVRDGHLPGKMTFIDRIKEVKRPAVFFANQGVVS